MPLLLGLLCVDALLCGPFTVLHGLEHLLGILLAHAALLLLLPLLVLILLILILLVFILVFILILVLILILVFILIFILIFILVLVVLILILVFVFILLLLLELGKAQVVTCLLVIGVATQGVLVELYSLVILLSSIGDVAQIIAGFAAQLLVLCPLGEVGEQALGLLHRVLVIVLL